MRVRYRLKSACQGLEGLAVGLRIQWPSAVNAICSRAQGVASCSYSCYHVFLIVLSSRCYYASPARTLCIHRLVLLRSHSKPETFSERGLTCCCQIRCWSRSRWSCPLACRCCGHYRRSRCCLTGTPRAGCTALHSTAESRLEQHSCTETEDLVAVSQEQELFDCTARAGCIALHAHYFQLTTLKTRSAVHGSWHTAEAIYSHQ